MKKYFIDGLTKNQNQKEECMKRDKFKMALKDWKIIARHKDYINWGKKFPSTDAVRIDKMYLKEKGWQLMVGERYANSSTVTGVRVIKDEIKTKSKAIALARQYMRSH